MTTESIILAAVTAAGAGLSGAVAKMWIWITNELKECKEDRKDLYNRVDTMHGEIREISVKVARMEGEDDITA